MAKSDYSTELKKGSIQLCIMSLLQRERMYGFQMIKELRELSDGYFDLKEGTLYPALHRLEKKGYLISEWVTSDDRPPKKHQVVKKKRLNLRKIEEFKYEMNDVLRDLPPNLEGTIKGSIIAKADKIDINAAIDFISEKVEEGHLTKDQAKRLGRILGHYSFYR